MAWEILRGGPVLRRRVVTGLGAIVVAPQILRGKAGLDAPLLNDAASSADPIARMLSTMVSGQWKELTGASAGNFPAAQQARTLANWDFGGASAPTTWTSDANVGNPFPGIDATGPGNPSNGLVYSFSASTIRSDGQVIHFGGGHATGGSGDNSVLTFSSKSACQKLLGAGGSQNWLRLVDGGKYSPQSYQKPSWSSQNPQQSTAAATTGTYGAGASSIVVRSITTYGGLNQAAVGWSVGGPDIPRMVTIASISGTGPYTIGLSGGLTSGAGTNAFIGFSASSFWAQDNDNGQHRTTACHSYNMCMALGLSGYWSITGLAPYGPNGDGAVPGSAQEIVNDDGTTFFTVPLSSPPQAGAGYAFGQCDFCDLDQRVYAWSTSNRHLYQFANPTATNPTVNDLGAHGNGPENVSTFPARIIQWPNSTKRAFFSYNPSFTPTKFEFCKDITGTPSASVFDFGTLPILAAAYPGICFDSARARVAVFDGTGQLSFINIPADPAGATWVQESAGRISGDIPALGNGFFRIEYLPIQGAYVAVGYGRVYLRKP